MSWVERSGRVVALAGLVLMWPLPDAFAHGAVRADRIGLVAVAAVAYCAVYGWYCLRGSGMPGIRVPLATIAALTLLAVALEHLTGMVATNYFLIPLLVAGFSLSPRRAIVGLGLVTAGSILDAALVTGLPAQRVAFQFVLFIPALLLFGVSGMGLRYLLRLLAELRAARAEIGQHAADQERARIARDLHDLLGHNLSLITLKGELATRLLPEGTPGTDEVRDMVGLSREALRQVREAVSGYRQPTLATELKAARVALQAAGVALDIKQGLGALDRETEAVLGWVIREATTNAIRHSGAKRCDIVLNQEPGEVRIEVTNDGRRVPQMPAGNGLRGLEERLDMLGGRLDASAMPNGGFRLRATVPRQLHADPDSIDVEVTT